MNAKERVRAAIARQPVDRIPLGLLVTDYDTVEAVIGHETYVRNKVKAQVGFWEGRRDEVVESYKKDIVEFHRRIGLADLISPWEVPLVPAKGEAPEDPPHRIADEYWQDSRGRVYKVSQLANEIAVIEDPTAWAGEYTVEQFQSDAEVAPPDPSVFEVLDYVQAELGPDHYIAGHSGGLDAMALLGNMERGLLEYALHPDVVKAAIDHHRRRGNAADCHYIRPGQDGVMFGQDTGGTMGPLISPRMYREFCFAAIRDRTQHIKSFGHQVIMHNCGNNRSLMPMFVEAGIDCYESLQTNANMDIPDLQEEWGHAMAFWGGVPNETLIDGTPDEIRAEVTDIMRQAGPRGGFILGPSQSIAKGTRYANFMAMLETFDALADECAYAG
ncbi:MAG: uroporphyrinogen decarboxylase family protein [Anaerolineae bacterium]